MPSSFVVGFKEGAFRERERVAAYLRRVADGLPTRGPDLEGRELQATLRELADDIAKGLHVKEEG